MKALLVTSEVTFVPNNYAGLVQRMAECPHIGGLLILKNRQCKLLAQAMGLLLGGAPRFGWTLMKNFWQGSAKHQETYQKAGKPVWYLENINTEEALQIIHQYGFDLVVNARTRYIYKRPILEMPPLGCINIHHGLLPNQRGVMCDLWALSEGQPAGFTIHKMNVHIDDGEILEKVIVSQGKVNDFMDYVLLSSQRESDTLAKLLHQIAERGIPLGQPNLPTEKIIMKKTPSLKDIKKLKSKGLKL
jgi:methionyl-tRNA formyltransferase